MLDCYIPKNVLLVEDSLSYQALILEAFEALSQSCKLYIVNNGEAALEFLRQQPSIAANTRPDLILLDLNLPKMSGLDVLKIIKHDRNLQTIPVIILSASHQLSDIRECYRQLANCYVHKPSNWDNLFNLIKEILFFWLHIVTPPPQEIVKTMNNEP